MKAETELQLIISTSRLNSHTASFSQLEVKVFCSYFRRYKYIRNPDKMMKEDESKSNTNSDSGGEYTTTTSTTTTTSSNYSRSRLAGLKASTTDNNDGTETNTDTDNDNIEIQSKRGEPYNNNSTTSSGSGTITTHKHDHDVLLSPQRAPAQAAAAPRTFPLQLMELIERETLDEDACVDEDGQKAIEWLPEGDKFIIRDKDTMENCVLPKYFNDKCMFMSFVRKLYR